MTRPGPIRKISKHRSKLAALLERALLDHRGYIFRPPLHEAVIILMSGGIDSSIAADLCISSWKTTVFPCYIKRGAKAEREELRLVFYSPDAA